MKTRYFLLLACMPIFCQQGSKFFESPDNVILLGADLHTHTVFSDGMVWPTIRVQEALRENIEIIAITDHLEYQPKKQDIPNPDLNRSYIIAKGSVSEKDLIVLRGSEITRDMPPGHFNAIFIKDANKLLNINDSIAGIIEANKQGAFVFWNHPNWTSKNAGRIDGIARLDPLHKELISKNLIHGLEVANEDTFSEEALEIAIENNLTILGTSDIHGLVDWDFDIPNGGHRPLTFILSKDQSIESIKDALFNGDTFVWFKDLIIGKEESILPIIKSNLNLKPLGYSGDTTLLEIEISNLSSMPFSLHYTGNYTFHKNSKFITIPKKSSIIIQVKTVSKTSEIKLTFEILNAVSGLKESPKLDYNLKIQ